MKGVKDLEKGDYFVYRAEPFKVLKKENVTFSTHSHTKVRVEVQGLFSNNKETLTMLPHATVNDIVIQQKRAQLIAKSAGKAQIMDLVSYETLEADIDAELLNNLAEGDEVTFVEFEGKVRVLEKR